MKKLFVVFLVIICLFTSSFSVSAESYSSDYPVWCFNSGSKNWIECYVSGIGRCCILFSADLNSSVFGFDTSVTGYNLINNSPSSITGICYSQNGVIYNVRFPSFYGIQYKLTSSNTYSDSKITAIYGTSLDLIDNISDRQNDNYVDYQLIILCCCLLVVFLLVLLLMLRVVRQV